VTKVVDACWQAFQTIDRLQPKVETESRSETPVADNEDSDIGKTEERIGTVSSDDALISDAARRAMLEMEKIRTVLVSRCWMLGMVSLSGISCHVLSLILALGEAHEMSRHTWREPSANITPLRPRCRHIASDRHLRRSVQR
jgi:hypothetical protein